MFTGVGSVSVFVEDQDRAKDFYVNTLGMELFDDAPLYPGAPNRWISVAPKGTFTTIILYKADENWEHYAHVVGKQQALTVQVDDMMKMYDQLTAKGVQFVAPPDPQPWGTYATLIDSEGNQIILVERPKA
jgi:catechol 2,3-dioxygenase-like lactoylglutathione lyase family enzyme